MTKKYLLEQIKHHIKLSYSCYEIASYKFMLAEFYKAYAYYDLLCKFYSCKEMFIVYAKDALGNADVDNWADKVYTVEVDK